MLILIDGLDECIGQKDKDLTLKMIFDALPYLRGRIKFLIVSRAEFDIQRSFNSAATRLGWHLNIIELQGDLGDVRLYLLANFDRIKQTHPLQAHLPPNWPSDNEIGRLVEKSSGHFIYASTVIKYIENDFDQPQERLDIIVNLRTSSQNPYAELDALYFNILTSSRTECAVLVNIFSIVVLSHGFNNKFFYEWKSDRFMESVLLLKPTDLELAILDLKSLARISPFPQNRKRGFIECFHKSFFDFILDPSRSKEFHASSAAYTRIAKDCLRLLSDKTDWPQR